MNEAIAITRVGLVAGCGVGTEACWEKLKGGSVSPRPLCAPSGDDWNGALGHVIEDWSPKDYWKRRAISYYTRSAQFALKATEECLEGIEDAERSRFGVVLGSQFSTIHNFHRVLEEPEFMTPIKFLAALPSSTPTNVSITCKLQGISTSVSSSVAGLEALTYAAELLSDGFASALLAGGAEEISDDLIAGCQRAGVLAGHRGHPERGALAPGEGAGMVLLETLAHAGEAGRSPLALVAGWGTAYAPVAEDRDCEAGARAMGQALAAAGIEPQRVDAVFIGANGWSASDALERKALAALFGSRPVACVALKERTGEVFGAFGAVAASAAALALDRQELPIGDGRAAERLETVLVHDRGWDGNHAAVVLTRPVSPKISRRAPIPRGAAFSEGVRNDGSLQEM